MLEFLQGASLVAATISVGLMAGVFYVYAHAIMPGLGRTDDRTFVAAFQATDRAIINPWFIPVFIGALPLLVLAAAIKAAGDPDAIDVAAVRRNFDEGRCARFNVVRAVASTGALGCLAWALVEFGRM
jgi:uncharacterized membrane protein